MTPRDFTYWLQGFFEISEGNYMTQRQIQIVKDHLALVFKKETPDRSESLSFDGEFKDIYACGEKECNPTDDTEDFLGTHHYNPDLNSIYKGLGVPIEESTIYQPDLSHEGYTYAQFGCMCMYCHCSGKEFHPDVTKMYDSGVKPVADLDLSQITDGYRAMYYTDTRPIEFKPEGDCGHDGNCIGIGWKNPVHKDHYHVSYVGGGPGDPVPVYTKCIHSDRMTCETHSCQQPIC